MRQFVYFCALIGLLGGCAGLNNSVPPPHSFAGTLPHVTLPVARLAVAIEASPFEPTVAFKGIEASYPDNPLNTYFLRSFTNKTTGATQHQLYVAHYYEGSWIFWNDAKSQDAQALPFASLLREVVFCNRQTGCSYAEHFGASISDPLLRAHLDGFAVKFYARTGQQLILTLTQQQIRQQLKAIDDFQATLKAAK